MRGEPPFRSDLDAAHRRIEQLTAEYEARLAELRAENVRLLQRVVDANMSRPPRPLMSANAFTLICSMVVVGTVVLFVVLSHRSSPVEHVGPTLLPPVSSINPTIAVAPLTTTSPLADEPYNPLALERHRPKTLPSCRCTRGDPLCTEILGQTCAPR